MHFGHVVRVFLCLFFCLSAVSPAAGATVEEMAGQMIMVGFHGTGEAPQPEDLRVLFKDVAHGRVGGVILFERDVRTGQRGRNIRSLQQVRALTDMLQAEARVLLFIGVDQEGGRVQRFLPAHGVPGMPPPKEMGLKKPAETRALADALGGKLREAGINLDFAPSLDLDVNPQSPAIGALGRSFSRDPKIVTTQARAFAAGLEGQGVLFCWKHFPGHGSAQADSHQDLPDITGSWTREELEPYRALLQPGQPGMVMVGHLFQAHLDPNLPTSLSAKVINGILRKELGWNGVVITDDLQMGAISDRHALKETVALAVNAGVDVLLFGNNQKGPPFVSAGQVHKVLVELVREGAIDKTRLEESYARIIRLKDRLAVDTVHS